MSLRTQMVTTLAGSCPISPIANSTYRSKCKNNSKTWMVQFFFTLLLLEMTMSTPITSTKTHAFAFVLGRISTTPITTRITTTPVTTRWTPRRTIIVPRTMTTMPLCMSGTESNNNNDDDNNDSSCLFQGTLVVCTGPTCTQKGGGKKLVQLLQDELVKKNDDHVGNHVITIDTMKCVSECAECGLGPNVELRAKDDNGPFYPIRNNVKPTIENVQTLLFAKTRQ